MKIAVIMVLIMSILSGCRRNEPLDQAMELRKSILDADSCSFLAVITADYGEEIYTFQMECVTDCTGALRFTVIDPESISGITGEVSKEDAALTFENSVLAFPMLAEGRITPVSTPWVFLNSLKGGYISGCGAEDNGICIYIDDSFQDNPLHLQIYTDEYTIPIRVEIIWNDRRVVSIDIRNFTLQ